jgi:hypothetical protein
MEELLKTINRQQLENFNADLNKYVDKENTMKKHFFLSIYLGNFLGNYFKSIPDNINDQKFNNYCHKVIDSISLCGDETYFFHEMVNIKETNNYINKCIELYNSIENLKHCQLGENILKCLESSKHLTIT